MEVILRNSPHNTNYESSSFLGLFHEERVWNNDKYWLLEKDIYSAAEKYEKSDIPRDVLWPVTRIFSHLFLSFSAHYDKEDGFEIQAEAGFLRVMRERIQLVYEGFIKGEMPNNDDFEIVNPLLQVGA